MQKAAAFFGGAVLGGVISAACGFDLFREERDIATREALSKTQDELLKSKTILARARELLAKSEEKVRELSAKDGGQEASVGGLLAVPREKNGRAPSLEEKLAQACAEADRLRNDAARAVNELAAARQAGLSAVLEAKSWKGQLNEQMFRFFSKERDAEDAALVSRYLASASSKDEKQALILELIKRNKQVLMSLPHDVARALGPRHEEAAGSSVVGAAAREEPREPVRASVSGGKVSSSQPEPAPGGSP